MYAMLFLIASIAMVSVASLKLEPRDDTFDSISIPRAEGAALSFLTHHQVALQWGQLNPGAGSQAINVSALLNNHIVEYNSNWESIKYCTSGVNFDDYSTLTVSASCNPSVPSADFILTFGSIPTKVGFAAFQASVAKASNYSFNVGRVLKVGSDHKIMSSAGLYIVIPPVIFNNTDLVVGDIVFLSRI